MFRFSICRNQNFQTANKVSYLVFEVLFILWRLQFNCAVRFVVLGIPAGILKVQLFQNQHSQKRIGRIIKYLTNSDSPIDLRRAWLSLRSTLFATSLTAKKHGDGDVPILVRIAKGEVQVRMVALLVDMLANLAKDLHLHSDVAVSSLV